MSTKTASDAPKANGEGSQPNKTWTSEEGIKVLLLIMQHENPDLAVSGWKSIGEKAQKLFNKKYSMAAVKHQFQRLRNSYMSEIPEEWKEKSKNNGDEAGETPGKGKKRAAPSTDEPTATTPKAKKPRAIKKVTNGTDGLANDVAADDSDGEKRKPAKPMSQRRGTKKSQSEVDDDKEVRAANKRASRRKNSQKAVTAETQSADSPNGEPVSTSGPTTSEDDAILNGLVGDDQASSPMDVGQVSTP
ncbi:hypothetical protein F4805DRAFT_460513 [Annulohypoxylon moriforme]|nr:hypothetical protein F4805DRAFT_460513 [Annulohypoxylon moriforme]